jgi:hypothetical protein
MVGGVGACHLVGHRRGGSGRSRAETTGEALGVPLPEPQHRGRRLLWRRQVNKGPTCCTRKSYWGATKKAFDVDQYGAPPINRSKEDDQSGCTRNPHWGAAKRRAASTSTGLHLWTGRRTARRGCQRRCLRGAKGSCSVQGPGGARDGANGALA